MRANDYAKHDIDLKESTKISKPEINTVIYESSFLVVISARPGITR